MKFNLEKGWKLITIPNRDMKTLDLPTNISELEKMGYDYIDAKVPGNFELDLIAARKLGFDDPYFGANILELQKLENLHIIYYNCFNIDFEPECNTFINFDGIDTVSDIYLNGNLIGYTENMLIEHTFSVGDLLKRENNELIVHIHPSTLYARDYEVTAMCNSLYYNYDSLVIRKAASMYGWDIMPRAVSGGIWKPVYIEKCPEEYIDDIYIYSVGTDAANSSASINVFYSIKSDADLLHGLRLKIHGKCRDSEFYRECSIRHTYGCENIFIGGAKLWWPKNAGEPNLYDIDVTLTRNGEAVDVKNMRFGVRTVELDRTSTTDREGNGEFCFKINGKKVFAMGSNWVPLDAFHSNDINRLPRALEMLNDIGCNIVRCWGGNVYENNEFYDFCDEHGIMVWQDFGMGCAVYPQDERFCSLLADEAVAVIKRLRNHASLVLWAGDNECDCAYNWNSFRRDPNQNILTRKILPDAIHAHDFTRPYLPSSPFIDEKAYQSGAPTSEDHLWGPRDYFKGDYYKNTVAHFASETGYHGCPSPESLKKFISKEQLWPITSNGITNNDWHIHASNMEPTPNGAYSYRIPLMTSQIHTLFDSEPSDLETYAKMSQISQAEAKKYFIERFRSSKWRRTGIIWWNLIDGWPQISDAVVDYYYTKKLAYHYIKRSQSPVCFMSGEPENGVACFYGVNDLPHEVSGKLKIENVTDGVTVFDAEFKLSPDSSTEIMNYTIPRDEHKMYLMSWESDGGNGKNHYYTNIINISYESYVSDAEKSGILEYEGF